MKNGEIKIEKGIPMPPPRHVGGNNHKYPWHQMELGDSFYVEPVGRTLSQLVSTLHAVARNARKKTGRKFALRKDGTGVRVWRIE